MPMPQQPCCAPTRPKTGERAHAHQRPKSSINTIYEEQNKANWMKELLPCFKMVQEACHDNARYRGGLSTPAHNSVGTGGPTHMLATSTHPISPCPHRERERDDGGHHGRGARTMGAEARGGPNLSVHRPWLEPSTLEEGAARP